jgi:hypothetical protein
LGPQDGLDCLFEAFPINVKIRFQVIERRKKKKEKRKKRKRGKD